MHSHLAIIGTNGELALKPDTSLTVTDKNPMFNDVEMFTQTIPLPFDLNRHVLKNMDDVNSTMRSADVQGERFQFVLDGIPFRNAAIKIQEGTKLDGTIDVNFDATNRTFKDMIADMRCRDVTVDDDILIGEKIGDLKCHVQAINDYGFWVSDNGGLRSFLFQMRHLEDKGELFFNPPCLGFSYPGECYENASTHEADPSPYVATKVYPNPNKSLNPSVTVKVPRVKTSYINVSQPYPAAKYCNSRIAYSHHQLKMDEYGNSEGETDSSIVPSIERRNDIEEDKSPYWVLDANRPASGICFYIGYFLERLFKTLGVAYDMTALTNIEDFNYLAFFSTSCHYEERVKQKNGADVTLSNEEQINKWLESRGCGGQINKLVELPTAEVKNVLQLNHGEFSDVNYFRDRDHERGEILAGMYYADFLNRMNAYFDSMRAEVMGDLFRGGFPLTDFDLQYLGKHHPYFYKLGVTANSVITYSAKVFQMFANSDNFPDVTVTEIIESLENSFGVRFCYDAEINKVTVKLLRDMFCDTQDPIPFKGTVLKMVKMTENIRGIRMKYSAESDAQEQRDNIRYNKRDYNTNYDYCDYPQGRTQFASYSDITEQVDVGNRNGYCDMATGDFFRIKVSADASTTDELQPAVFEVGALHGVELGDCSKEAEDEDAIKEFVSSFEPIIVNDVAYRGKNYDATEYKPLLVPFIDEDMEHEFLIKKLLNPVSVKWGTINVVYELCMSECYDPSSTDDGQSPLMTHDWGLTVGFLRPGNGNGNTVIDYDINYDGFGNARWRVEGKDYCFTSDTFDVLGNFLGVSPAGSFSLKPSAYKPFRYKYVDGQLRISTNPNEWMDDPSWLIPCNDDEPQGVITARRRSRGMCDTWMREFFHFLLNRQVYYVEALCTAAELADIPNKWLRRWEIDGKVGWINLMTYPVNTETGLGKVELEFYSL